MPLFFVLSFSAPPRLRVSLPCYKGEAQDRQTWDQLRVLYACRPSVRHLCATSAAGNMTLSAGRTFRWTDSPNRNRSYAYVNDMAKMRAQLTELMMHDPREAAR